MDVAEAGGSHNPFAAPQAQAALGALLAHLTAADYAFTSVTPATHRRVLRRPAPERPDLRDAFGWNRPFDPALLPDALDQALHNAHVLHGHDGLVRSRVRASTVDGGLYLHSAFPTREEDAVFLGPDTYRFVRLLRQRLAGARLGHVADLGAGAGVGGLSLCRFASVGSLALVDVNPRALDLARANAAFAGAPAREVLAGDLREVGRAFDLVVANPPFIGGSGKTYSDGGGGQGAEVPIAWIDMALDCLAPGGRLLMYTGSPVRADGDPIAAAAQAVAAERRAQLSYEEIDPDIFGSQLNDPDYAQVERIAAVAVDIRLPD